ncbi:Bug family tripartite tricarboxylate transporter substrate binding protein [Bordetella petrii]|uniref:Bug family tripartite tricarboxylate transporter substrate binding protein n=1 Tax=Bordetella petrii TaxID=94624 RepID=UPI001E5BF7FF|nr:tripartite tricarboxylate transporter substrate binding protein [Bordetella petrii]MCD0501755.1 tripartite tricarboxylate transporter substrate binding protein [Bordetella petrii]
MLHTIPGSLRALILGTLIATAPALALAQDWPAKPVRIIVPAGAGGSADPLARLVAEQLSQALHQPFVVENKPGANGNVGSVAAVRSAPDGYTLLFSWTGTLVPAITLYHAKPYHPQKDLDPIALIASVPNIIVTLPSLGIKTVDELTAYARKNPGKLNFGSTGSGSSYHLSGELYKKTLDVDMTHVPYSSPSAVFTDLIGGRLQLAFPGVTAAAPLVKDGQLQAVAVMAPKRSNVLPDVPTTAEQGQPTLLSETWFGLLAPSGTPPATVQKINAAVNNALQVADFRKKLAAMGFEPMGGTSAQFASTLDSDIKKWGEIVKFSGAKVD